MATRARFPPFGFAITVRTTATGEPDSALVDIATLPADLQMARSEPRADGFNIQRSGESGQTTFPSSGYLPIVYARNTRARRAQRDHLNARKGFHLCRMDHSVVPEDKEAGREWLRAVARDGLALLRNVPAKDGYV
jgi:hypothetical protein